MPFQLAPSASPDRQTRRQQPRPTRSFRTDPERPPRRSCVIGSAVAYLDLRLRRNRPEGASAMMNRYGPSLPAFEGLSSARPPVRPRSGCGLPLLCSGWVSSGCACAASASASCRSVSLPRPGRPVRACRSAARRSFRTLSSRPIVVSGGVLLAAAATVLAKTQKKRFCRGTHPTTPHYLRGGGSSRFCSAHGLAIR